MTRRILAVACAAAVIMAAAALFLEPVQQPFLVVSDGGGKRLAEIRLPQGRFDHVFVHSFHLTPVVERFRVGRRVDEAGAEGKAVLRLYELRYQSSGVGMPSDAELGYRLEDGFFVLAMDRAFDAIPLRVSVVDGHGLRIEGSFTPFTKWAPKEGALILSGELKRGIRIRR
jgi:hypothetical protein